MTIEQEFRSTLISLLSDPAMGLPQVAAIADLVASDARFNDWMAVSGKRILSDNEFLDTLGKYEEVEAECLSAVARFRTSKDITELEIELRRLFGALESCRRE